MQRDIRARSHHDVLAPIRKPARSASKGVVSHRHSLAGASGLCRVTLLTFLLALTIILVPDDVTHAQRPGRVDFDAMRRQMVDEELASEGITNPRVLEAMRTVPRHLFVRTSLRHMAYYDQALDIGYKQTISPPFIVAYMTEVLDPQPEDRVLEIGTGSGYQAAVLAGLVKDVYTIEIVEPLGKRTGKLLDRMKYDNVHTRIGDGYKGWPDHAPFDKIIVTCSPEDVPQPLVEQLKEGGRMIVPLGQRYQQVFYLFEKQDGELKQTKLLPTLFVPMTGKSEELRDIKPDPLNPTLINGGFEQNTIDESKADGWHYQRRSRLVEEDAPEGRHYLCFENDDPGREAHILQGLAIDGSQVHRITVRLKVKTEDIKAGPQEGEKPGLSIHFFDARRIPIGQQAIGPWTRDTADWQTIRERLIVPRNAREAILQVGLRGATGVLCLDDLSLEKVD